MSILDWFRPAKRPEPTRCAPYPATIVYGGTDGEVQFRVRLHADGTAEYDREALKAWATSAKTWPDGPSLAIIWLLMRELERQTKDQSPS